ncbi:hypothetical protein [Flavihumibacter sp. CACIAM 22H1]|uniref:hypothetical protein n=1 Tax=Flavihumibacter sp. CACIAM 22H1 TaxID=1812911 RepID=UPI0007A821C7|nr:hypothetical protein [Flavihumibacter sp. CACIAM 22H1]KYP13548.1 MAG: hypothetical protein A1D16_17470 [Flavihumibacter sp. CACIAM 22H1]
MTDLTLPRFTEKFIERFIELIPGFEYDSRGRMIVKKIPGAAPVYMVYDKWDRVVLTQDGVLRPDKKWLYTKYDHLNRPLITGMYEHSSVVDQPAMQTVLNAANLARFETFLAGSTQHSFKCQLLR